MTEEAYPFQLSPREYRYEFVSVSADKEVRKVVLISSTATSGLFNLALLDVQDDGMLSDLSKPNNKDFRKILATVYKVIENFFMQNPDISILFRGSDERRQRLYRIVITREIDFLRKSFVILGVMDDEFSLFESDKPYEFFIITKAP